MFKNATWLKASFVLCVSVLCASPAPEILPKDVEVSLLHLIQTEVVGEGDVDATKPIAVKGVECFGGITMFSLSGIGYEIFPSLGLYRVCALQDPSEWLFMDINLEPKKNAIITRNSEVVVDPELMGRIRACGSGILKVDITKAQLTCGRIDSYRLATIRVILNDGNVMLSDVIMDENNKVCAVRTGKIWKKFSGATEPHAPTNSDGRANLPKK